MECIVYVSAATRSLGREEVASILRVSRENNARDGITGVLMVSDDNFMQVLEGETDALNACVDRISHDSRHHRIIILDRWMIDVRSFPEWSMELRNMHDLPEQDRNSARRLVREADQSNDSGFGRNIALTFVKSFRDTMGTG